MKNIIVRSLSGAVYVALIVAAILLRGTYSDWIFLTLFGLFIALGIHEVHLLGRGKHRKSPTLVQIIDVLGGIGLFGALYVQVKGLSQGQLWLVPIALYFLLRAIVQLYMPRQNALALVMRSALSVIYVALPLSLVHAIVPLTNDRMLLAMFIFIWTFDTGAFLVGSAIGRHRLFERISPKKSWEGVVGGIALAMLVAWGLHHYADDFFSGPSLKIWLGMAAIVAVFSTLGDLFESLLKRTAGVKDSGRLIPGHGGILDRIDSLLFVIPALLVFFVLIGVFKAQL